MTHASDGSRRASCSTLTVKWLLGRERERILEDGACGGRGRSNADRTQPVSAGGSAQHDDLIMSHMRRELLGGGSEQSVNWRNIDLLHGTSFLQTGFCVVRRTACDVRHARSRDHASANARTLCSFVPHKYPQPSHNTPYGFKAIVCSARFAEANVQLQAATESEVYGVSGGATEN